jgi:uncharacterized protein
MAGMPAATLLDRDALCILLAELRRGCRRSSQVARRPACSSSLWKAIVGAPTPAIYKPGPRGPGFFDSGRSDGFRVPHSRRRSEASPFRPQHGICRTWLDNLVRGDERFGLSPLALAALIRITTNRRIYAVPSSFDVALGFCDDLIGQPHCQIVEPRERHRDIFKRLCGVADIRGPRVTGAWYAALAIEWGCEWITLDRDYARFPGLRWRTPGALGE